MTAVLHHLANGVRVIVDEMADIQSAAVGVWFDAGAVDEGRDANGLAHLLEHMAFKGTRRRTAKQIAEQMEAVGGHLNASTGYQRTGYYARVLEEDLETAFDIIADILTEPAFANEELVKEKEVVIQEIGEAADTPDDAVFDQLQSAAFGHHAMARPILGTPESVRLQTGDNLRHFMSEFYRPANTIVTAAGSVNSEKVLALSEQYFGSKQQAQRPTRVAPASYVGGVQVQNRDIEQTHIALAFEGVSARHDDMLAMRVFTEALGGGMASRIFQEVREERGLAYSAYAFSEHYDDVGLLCAYIGTEARHVGDAIGIVQREIAAMATAPTDAEIKRARAMLKASLLMGLENPIGRAEASLSKVFLENKLENVEELIVRLERVTAEDVARCAAKAIAGPISISAVGSCDGEEIAKLAL